MKTLLERFCRKIITTKGCWQWLGSKNQKGYGLFGVCGKTIKAHRFSFEVHRGFIPKGMTLDHLCRNRSCVNPWHLEIVPVGENVLRGYAPPAQNARKTRCKRGHLFDTTRKDGGRGCSQCLKLKYQERRPQLLEYQKMRYRMKIGEKK